jgi:very-short-patch-repair endonuclease
MNRTILGHKVDAIWRERKLAVELDGGRSHGNQVAVHVDRARDLCLRQAGWIVLRYSRQQIESDWPTVLAELRAHLGPPELIVLDTAER